MRTTDVECLRQLARNLQGTCEEELAKRNLQKRPVKKNLQEPAKNLQKDSQRTHEDRQLKNSQTIKNNLSMESPSARVRHRTVWPPSSPSPLRRLLKFRNWTCHPRTIKITNERSKRFLSLLIVRESVRVGRCCVFTSKIPLPSAFVRNAFRSAACSDTVKIH